MLTAVCQKEKEAEAQRKLKQEQQQQKKKSNFGLLRRFQKAFKSTREDPRNSPEVIENPSVQDPESMFNEMDNSAVGECVRSPSSEDGTEMSDSFVMVKPGKDREKGLRRLRSVMKKQPDAKGSPMVYAKTEVQKSPLKNSVSDPGDGLKYHAPPRRAIYPLQPRTSRSLPVGSPPLSQQQIPPAGAARSGSLPTKPVETGLIWQRKSACYQDSSDRSESGSSLSSDSTVRSRSYSNSASRTSLPQRNNASNRNLSTSQSSIASKSSGNSDGGRFRRLSAEGKKPRIATTRGGLAPETDKDKVKEPLKIAKPSKLQAPKSANAPASRLEYKPNPIKPLAFRDHNRSEGKDTKDPGKAEPVAKSTRQPVDNQKVSRLPTAGKENTGKGETSGVVTSGVMPAAGGIGRLQPPSRPTSLAVRETAVM